ncbi:MAG: PfkB family carbohydrate kinase, partial [Promethearchaeota archaeon]
NYSDVLFFSSVNFEDPSPVMKFLHKWDPDKIIIAGMSEKGCALGYNNKISYYSPVKVIKYPVIDTNGAGDELVVGFLSSYFIERFSIEESIHRGQIAARYSCSIKGSSSNLITKQQLNKYFSELEGE